MSDADTFATARDQVQMWKHVEVVRYLLDLIQAARYLRVRGVHYVGSDDVAWTPLPENANGETVHSIPGSAIAAARNAGILADNFATDVAAGVFGGRRRSKRADANGRKVSTYAVVWPVADEYTRRHKGKVWGPQVELALV
jgi:hypothetical protein